MVGMFSDLPLNEERRRACRCAEALNLHQHVDEFFRQPAGKVPLVAVDVQVCDARYVAGGSTDNTTSRQDRGLIEA